MEATDVENKDCSIWAEVAVLLVGMWFAFVCIAFWWFESRLLQPFMYGENSKAVFFDGERLMQQLGSTYMDSVQHTEEKSIATVLHFWDPDCPCNSKNDTHVNNIIETYGNEGVQFIIVTPDADSLDQARDRFSHVSVTDFMSTEAQGVSPPSSPAAVVINAFGDTSYFGPYSIGAQCLSENGAFVENILDSLLQHKQRTQVNTAAVGCFCDWSARV